MFSYFLNTLTLVSVFVPISMGAMAGHVGAGQGTIGWRAAPIATEGEVRVADASQPRGMEMPVVPSPGVKPAKCGEIVTFITSVINHPVPSVEDSFNQAWN